MDEKIEKYHFSFLRNLVEKTATFLGYKRWENLLEKAPDGNQDFYANRVLNLACHSAHAGEEISYIEEKDKEKLEELVKFLTDKYGFNQEEQHA